jgi:outer membrane lipoprotein carrier protein
VKIQNFALIALVAALEILSPLSSWAKTPALLTEVEKQYSTSGSFQAHFEQVEFSAAFGEKKQSQGHLVWKSPNRLRWETTSPERSLIVSNGKTVWIYTPPFDDTENGQVIIKKAAEVKSRLLDALLAGKFSAAVRQGLNIEKAGNREFKLKPPARKKKGPSGALKQVTVQIAPEKPTITKVSLEYDDGNQSTISFTNIEMGVSLPADSFNFKVPPRTDILKD